MIADTVKSLGGRDVVAAACRITPNAVYKWSEGDEPGIPPKHWPTLRDLSKGKLTLDKLERLNAEARRTARAA